jgi:hypothetical protein
LTPFKVQRISGGDEAFGLPDDDADLEAEIEEVEEFEIEEVDEVEAEALSDDEASGAAEDRATDG